jgi:hypothetical protein
MTSPWAPPGEVAAPPRLDAGEGPGEGPPPGDRSRGVPAVGASRRLPAPPLPLRPMTVADLLDGAFAIVKRRPADVLVIAAAFIVPVEVLSAVLLREVTSEGPLEGLDPDATRADTGASADPFAGLDATLASFAIGAVSLVLVAGALAHMVWSWYDGDDVPPASVVRHTLRRAPALLVGVVLVHVAELVGLLGLGVGAYVAMALLHVVAPVIVAEGSGPFRAVVRSVGLTSRRLGASLSVPALVGLIGALVGFGFQVVPEALTLVVPDGWDWLVRAAGQTIAQLVVVPFTAGVAVLYHLDLRIRSEGLDIRRRARAIASG